MKKKQYLAAAGLLIVFIIDTITPIIFSVDILYLCCIVIVFRQNSRTIISFSAVACLLIVIDVLLFDIELKLNSSFWINRGMSVLAILITSYMAIRYGKLNQSSKDKEQEHSATMEEILLITSHRVRKPVANILGLIEIVNDNSNTLSPDELRRNLNYLLSSAKELDTIIKELNVFIEHVDEENLTHCLMQPIAEVCPMQPYAAYPDLDIVA